MRRNRPPAPRPRYSPLLQVRGTTSRPAPSHKSAIPPLPCSKSAVPRPRSKSAATPPCSKSAVPTNTCPLPKRFHDVRGSAREAKPYIEMATDDVHGGWGLRLLKEGGEASPKSFSVFSDLPFFRPSNSGGPGARSQGPVPEPWGSGPGPGPGVRGPGPGAQAWVRARGLGHPYLLGCAVRVQHTVR